MSFFRPEVTRALHRGQELIAAGAVAAFGLWLVWLGGWVLMPLGLIVLALAVGWAVIARRRLRFAREVTAPGLVEVDEGQVGYFSAQFGGVLALDDVVELRLIVMGERRAWRLRDRAGQVLTIPTEAQGAEALHDAFATLPGIDMAVLAAALGQAGEGGVLWRRAEGGAAPIALTGNSPGIFRD